MDTITIPTGVTHNQAETLLAGFAEMSPADQGLLLDAMRIRLGLAPLAQGLRDGLDAGRKVRAAGQRGSG